ncbi:MAG: 30S ribosomal protein S12 methylthiotransferase RimO [Ignavibacteriae bacterium HGW-Ignavibacteriae-2]|jgi:ribosomal protein S12 methylthiotransferase|nr:30S ribosomal protein S12 methylthiotransferase RimO [Bacteroidota bacterium]PKL87109.1 MAG: 30S ribosomal protein S12 methylthiotransferase RimO [Ignavibacteriae bacterium HGW-Ignavibacteriae-2]
MNKKEKIGIITLGCSKNTVDSERLMSQLKLNRLDLVDDPNDADTVIINTCGFIDAAKEESINTILEATEMKKRGELKKVIVAGCLSERYMKELKKDIPEVDKFFGTEDYEGIIREFGGHLKTELLGERELTSPKHYAYLKISEGCDNPCSFCAIPLIRGKHKTKSIEDLIAESESLARKGVKELIIIGQDTTDYGKELYGKRLLSDLLNKLSEINGIEWIRLLYAYPSHFPDDVIETIASNPKVLKYIDMPLQHISEKVLKSMRRGISERRTKELIFKLKDSIPGLTLRTTFILGYPAETEKEFNDLCSFVKEVEFDRVGVFNYSVEENTPSFILGDPVSQEEKDLRKKEIMEIQKDISLKKNQLLVGSEQKVIIDGKEGEFFIGRSEKDAPEVDGEVLIESKKKMEIGNFYRVKIKDCNEYDLFAKF